MRHATFDLRLSTFVRVREKSFAKRTNLPTQESAPGPDDRQGPLGFSVWPGDGPALRFVLPPERPSTSKGKLVSSNTTTPIRHSRPQVNGKQRGLPCLVIPRFAHDAKTPSGEKGRVRGPLSFTLPATGRVLRESHYHEIQCFAPLAPLREMPARTNVAVTGKRPDHARSAGLSE